MDVNGNQKITPFLWFDTQAEEAAGYYVSVFDRARMGDVARYGEAGPGPAGQAMTVSFQIEGQEFTALNGGPQYHFTPAISFFVSCATEEEVDRLFARLSDGGEVLVPLGQYPFSEKFGWANDRFGVSWQVNLAPSDQKITPFLTFVGKQHGKAEEAINTYISLFDRSGVQVMERYGPGMGETEGTVMHARFRLYGQEFMAMDSGLPHAWTFTEAVSLYVSCESQAEVDRLWEKLSAGGEEGPCGWLKDRYGVSWQIVPAVLPEMLQDTDPEKASRVARAMFQMKKLDIAGLRQAYDS
jgi:predicted 3-demethylubiquinone-9 3-methyltransferase (glyoxalase superfamily)